MNSDGLEEYRELVKKPHLSHILQPLLDRIDLLTDRLGLERALRRQTEEALTTVEMLSKIRKPEP